MDKNDVKMDMKKDSVSYGNMNTAFYYCQKRIIAYFCLSLLFCLILGLVIAIKCPDYFVLVCLLDSLVIVTDIMLFFGPIKKATFYRHGVVIVDSCSDIIQILNYSEKTTTVTPLIGAKIVFSKETVLYENRFEYDDDEYDLERHRNDGRLSCSDSLTLTINDYQVALEDMAEQDVSRLKRYFIDNQETYNLSIRFSEYTKDYTHKYSV